MPPMTAAIDQTQLQRWADDAQAALRGGRADLAQPSLMELSKHAPRHPAVLLLRRWAALIAFDWPAARGPATFAQRAPPEVDLVLFHVDLPVAPSGLHGAIDYLAIAALSFEAAALRAPHARRVLITDERTRVPDGVGAHEVIRKPIDFARPMYERMRMQHDYLASRPAGRATVFMDVDVVPNRDPADIFASDFDIGLTWRTEFPDAPINGGLIFVGPGARGRAFFQSALRCYDALPSSPLAPLFDRDLRAWWGDQFVLALMVGYRELADHLQSGMTVDGAGVRFFPCTDYNFTPEAGNYTAASLASRYFLHFKGNRKAMQAQYLHAIRGGG